MNPPKTSVGKCTPTIMRDSATKIAPTRNIELKRGNKNVRTTNSAKIVVASPYGKD